MSAVASGAGAPSPDAKRPQGRRTAPAEAAPDPGWLRALGAGLLYAVLVVALLLLARAGAGFIYQGF